MPKRVIENETSLQTIGSSAASSSHEALYYHLISSSTLRRLAQRITSGAKKYGQAEWRQGINDAEYVRDRFNHLFEHLLKFKEEGNEGDDNIGAMLWALHCLDEVHRLCPDALKHVVGITNLFGDSATEFHKEEMKRRERKKSGTQ